jgi:hypothetical protein
MEIVRRRLFTGVLAGAAVATLLANGVYAADKSCEKSSPACCKKGAKSAPAKAPLATVKVVTICPATDDASTVRGDGMRAYIDPATGQLSASPSSTQADELTARVNAGAPHGKSALAGRPTVNRHANGTISMDVPEGMEEYAVVTLGKDGKPVQRCVTGPEAAALALSAPAPALEEK